MRIPRLYTPQHLTENATIQICDSAAHYLINVLRMKAGRQLVLFNGEGGEYLAVIEAVSKKAVMVSIQQFRAINNESPLSTELGVCVVKNDPMDWLIQKAVELGVTTIAPLMSDFTDVKINPERLQKKEQHWRQVVISACEQCGRTRIPIIKPLQPLHDWVEYVRADKKMVLHPYQAKPLIAEADKLKAIALLVGPEGGLSDAEIELAHQHEFLSLSLGPRILRAETAPLAALSLLQYYYGDA